MPLESNFTASVKASKSGRALLGRLAILGLALTLALAISGCSEGSGPEPTTESAGADPTAVQSALAESANPSSSAGAEARQAATTSGSSQAAQASPTAPDPTAQATVGSLASATTATTEAITPAATATPPPDPTAQAAVGTLASTATATTEAITPAAEMLGGLAYVVGEGSEATFTVNEKLAWLDLPNDAVMRTSALSGEVYLDGGVSEIEIDLHSLKSDSDRRDRYVQERMFPDHPVAVFTVEDLGQLPEPIVLGEIITQAVEGTLSIRGLSKPITFSVEARLDPDKLFILGKTTFTWDELEIPPPNIPGRIQVKDEVRVEVLLSTTVGGTGS